MVWVGIIFWQDTVTSLQGMGWGISLVGFAMYNHLKMQPSCMTQPVSSWRRYKEVPNKDIGPTDPLWAAQRMTPGQLSGDSQAPWESRSPLSPAAVIAKL